MAESDRLQILLIDYEQAREEERYYFNVETALIAVTLTAITVIGGIGFTSFVPAHWRNIVFPIAPMLAVVPLLFLIQAGATAVWRSYYIRALEREIRGSAPESLASYPGLPPMSYAEIYIGTSNGNGQGSIGVLRVVLTITYPIVVLIVGGLAVALALDATVVTPIRLIMLLLYGGGALGILAYVGYVQTRGREFFLGQVDVLHRRLAHGLRPEDAPAKKSRNSASYLVLPRPDELATKSPFLLLGVILGAFTAHLGLPDWWDVLRAGLLLVAVEYLIYQARYQWNDIRGYQEDGESTASVSRGRLPVTSRARPTSWLVILLRIFGVYIVTTIDFPAGDWNLQLVPAVWIALGVVAAIAIAYEALRWSGRKASSWFQLTLLFVVVGLGYPARLVVGYITVTSHIDPALIVAGVAAWALAVYFVALTWLIEAGSDYAWVRAEKGSTIQPTARIGSAAAAKPHLTALLRASGIQPPIDAPVTPDAAHRPTLRLVDLPRIPILPIGLVAAVWFPAWIVTAELLLARSDPWWVLVPVIAVSAILAAWPTHGRVMTWMLLAAAIPPIAFFAIVLAPGAVRDPLVWIPLAICILASVTPIVIYRLFSALDYEGTRAFVKKLLVKTGDVGVRIYQVASGISRGDRELTPVDRRR